MQAHAAGETGEAPYPSVRVASGILTVIAIATIVAYLDRQIITLVVEPIRADFGVSDTQMGLLYGAAFSICFALAGLPLGRLVDRVNRRNVLIAGILCWSTMTMACGFAENFTQLFVARMGVGLGEACLVPASYSLISDLFRREHLGRAAGVIGSATTGGAGASLIIGGAILRLAGDAPVLALPILGEMETWRAIFVLIGLPGFLIAGLMLSFREPARKGVAPRLDPLARPEAYLPFLRANLRTIVPLLLANVAIITAASGIAAWSPTTLIRRYPIAPGDVGLMVGVAMIIGGLAGPTLGGLATDRWTRAGRHSARMHLFAYGVPLCLVGHVLFAFAPTALLAVVGQIIGVTAAAGLTTAAMTNIQDFCPNRFRGQTSAVSGFLTNVIGLSLGPAAVAMINDGIFAKPDTLAIAILGVSVPSLLVAFVAARMVGSEDAVLPPPRAAVSA